MKGPVTSPLLFGGEFISVSDGRKGNIVLFESGQCSVDGARERRGEGGEQGNFFESERLVDVLVVPIGDPCARGGDTLSG